MTIKTLTDAATETLRAAIARSTSYDETVSLEWSPELDTELLCTADDTVAESDVLIVGWGVDEDGEEWQVRLEGRRDGSVDDGMHAVLRGESYCVSDDDGGLWCPSAEAADAIDAAGDPEAEVLRICRTEPMRGTWHS